MVTFRDIVGYRPSQARRILRHLNNQLNPSPSRPSQSPYAGSEVRLLTSVPPEIFGDIGIPIHQVGAHSTTVEASHPSPAQESQVLLDQPASPEEPATEIETQPAIARAPDPEPQSLGARILRAVWAPKSVPSRSRIEAGPSGGPSLRAVCVPDALPASSEANSRSLGGRSFSSDIKPALSSGVSTPEVTRTSKPRLRPRRPRIRKKTAVLPPTDTVSAPHSETGDTTLVRHQARCTICRHPERDAIEQAFLHWWRPSVIAYEFNLASRLAIYRHAHALGLFQRRNLRGQYALGHLVEQAQSIKPTADSIIRAVKALSCFDETGRYHEPRKEVLITHQVVNITTPAYPETAEGGRRACPEPAATGPRAYPEPATNGRSVPAHSYSIVPVGTGDSPIHLKLDSHLIDTHDEQNTDPTRIGVLSAAPRSEGSAGPQPSHRSEMGSPHLIDTDNEHNPPLTPTDAVT